MSYFISPRQQTDLKVDAAELVKAIQARWPSVEVHFPTSSASNHGLEWVVAIADRRLEGSLDKTGQVVHLVGDVEDCARFATWYRALVPPRYGLAFYDEGYSADVELADGTNEAQLTKPFLVR